MVFSRRIVWIYTLIVMVPLLIAVFGASEYLRAQKYGEIYALSHETVRKNVERLNEDIDSFDNVESMLKANDEMKLFLYRPESNSEDAIIETMREEATAMERLFFVMPRIYSVRLFTASPLIPERWPIMLNERRAALSSLRRWEFDYRADFLGNLDTLKEPSLCATREFLKDNKRHIGYVQISMRMKDVFPYLYSRENPYESDFAFSGRERIGKSLTEKNAPADPAAINARVKTDENARNGQFAYRERGVAYLVAWAKVPRMGLNLFHVYSTKPLEESISLLRLASLAVLLLSALILFSIIRFATSQVMARVYGLMDGMQRLGKGELQVSLNVEGSDEVSEAQRSFNAMAETIRRQIDQIKAEHALAAETEIKAMQNQINAHFLYNVLETIKMQAVLADEDDIAESVTALGKMMRYCLRWRSRRVSLKEEIEYARAYVCILNIRNDYVISLKTDIPPELEGMEVPKMILQPLIENAFTHAIEPKAQAAEVSLYAERGPEPGRVWLCVRDYGGGMDEAQLAAIRDYLKDGVSEREGTGGVGLKNIQQRLVVYYGGEYRLQLESSPGEGTLVRIPLPTEAQL
jgi:two-component system sensor histidine kinase YesM